MSAVPPGERAMLEAEIVRLRDLAADLAVGLEMRSENIEGFKAQWAELLASLPDCPTCEGKGQSDPIYCGSTIGYVTKLCRAGCDHGKATVAQMVATWQAVHGDAPFVKPPYLGEIGLLDAFDLGVNCTFDHLRAIR